jgi:hypothetical protein
MIQFGSDVFLLGLISRSQDTRMAVKSGYPASAS